MNHESQELAKFLKKLSSIPNDFIDDMFSLYNPDTAQTDFAVDLDAISKWLHVRKDNLMATLKASYTAGVDYEVIKKPSPHITSKYGRNAYKQVLLTPDCFKRLCMRSKGKTSEDVRSYFIQVEALVMKYRNHMMKGMQEDIERLESNMRARKLLKPEHAKEGYIYVLRASPKHDTVVKIGRTRDLVRRLREHTAALADDPEILYTFKTDNVAAVESCLKGWLKDRQWLRGRYKEVYKADINMVKNIIHGCDMVGHIKTVSKPPNANKLKQKGGKVNDVFIVVV